MIEREQRPWHDSEEPTGAKKMAGLRQHKAVSMFQKVLVVVWFVCLFLIRDTSARRLGGGQSQVGEHGVVDRTETATIPSEPEEQQHQQQYKIKKSEPRRRRRATVVRRSRPNQGTEHNNNKETTTARPVGKDQKFRVRRRRALRHNAVRNRGYMRDIGIMERERGEPTEFWSTGSTTTTTTTESKNIFNQNNKEYIQEAQEEEKQQETQLSSLFGSDDQEEETDRIEMLKNNEGLMSFGAGALSGAVAGGAIVGGIVAAALSSTQPPIQTPPPIPTPLPMTAAPSPTTSLLPTVVPFTAPPTSELPPGQIPGGGNPLNPEGITRPLDVKKETEDATDPKENFNFTTDEGPDFFDLSPEDENPSAKPSIGGASLTEMDSNSTIQDQVPTNETTAPDNSTEPTIISMAPSVAPSQENSGEATSFDTSLDTSIAPSQTSSGKPSSSMAPSNAPSQENSDEPSTSMAPSIAPSQTSSGEPTRIPSVAPSQTSTGGATSFDTSIAPSQTSSGKPSMSMAPSIAPSQTRSGEPTRMAPSVAPSETNSGETIISMVPSVTPSETNSGEPTVSDTLPLASLSPGLSLSAVDTEAPTISSTSSLDEVNDSSYPLENREEEVAANDKQKDSDAEEKITRDRGQPKGSSKETSNNGSDLTREQNVFKQASPKNGAKDASSNSTMNPSSSGVPESDPPSWRPSI